MPAVVQAPLVNNIALMVKERSAEASTSGFTAVNGRGSPPMPRPMPASDTIHVRTPGGNGNPDEDSKLPLPAREDRPANGHSGQPLNGHTNGYRRTDSPSSSSDGSTSPPSPGKRKRPDAIEEQHYQTQDSAPTLSRRRLDSYASVDRGSPPDAQSQHEVAHTYSNIHRDSRLSPNDQETTSPNSNNNQSQLMNTFVAQNAGTTETTRAGVQVDMKKRKRQFANRTKTGCGTCRRRKKKCDEGKPECNNCHRGGFICEGYAHKTLWPNKATPVNKHIPLLQAQVKEPYGKESYSGDANVHLYHTHGRGRDSYTDGNPGPPTTLPPIDGARTRPIVVDEAKEPWGGGWVQPTPTRASFPPDHPGPDYGRPAAQRAPPPGNERHEHAAPTAQSVSNSRVYHQSPQTLSNSPAVTAQLALQHQSNAAPHQHQPHHPAMHPPPAAAPGPPPSHRTSVPPPAKPLKSEKEKMLAGEPFSMFHSSLMDDREQCKAALSRFNNSGNPAVGISREERARYLRTIIEAPWTRHMRVPGHPPGHIGKETHVETPFCCDYGYNISIGDQVVIGTNCTILDSRRVIIGNNTIIGPNVNIYTSTVSTDPRKRNGSRSLAQAEEVVIEDNVFIGGNVTILPGVTIGKGSTVGAGSVVTKNVAPNVIVWGQPAKMKRAAINDYEGGHWG